MTNEWLPIESAPLDKMILLYRPTALAWARVTVGQWNQDAYAKRCRPFWEMWIKIGTVKQSREWEPTHWMPLPDGPLIDECTFDRGLNV